MAIIYKTGAFTDFDDTLKYVVKVDIPNNFFLYTLSSICFSFRDIRKKFRFNLRYDYASFWRRRMPRGYCEAI